MDNFSLKVVWRDSHEDLLEIKIGVITEFVTAHQYCYISSTEVINNMKLIRQHIEQQQNETKIIFGKMIGDYTPSFSMLFYKKKLNDDMVVELDLEIADNDERKHRCQLYLKSKADFWKYFSLKVEEVLAAQDDAQINLIPHSNRFTS